MNAPVSALAPVWVGDIPQLDAAAVYHATSPANGMARIILPSGHVAYHLTRYHEVLQVLTDARFVRRPCNTEDGPSFLPTITPNELLLNNDGASHARLRKVVAKDFSAAGVATLRDTVIQATHARLDALSSQTGVIDLLDLVLECIPAEVDCHLLGIPLADRSYYRPLTHTVQIADPRDVPELLRQFWLVYDYLMDLVTGRRTTAPHGLIRRFVAARHESVPPLNDEELVGILLGILIGGDQNILTVLCKVVYTLLAAPALWQSLRAQPATLPAMVEELLRLIPLGTTSTFPRIASEGVHGSFGFIPAGSVVYADVFAANRDPAVFADPLRIDPQRNASKHLQFGYGMHHCMGAALARMEITTVLEILLQRMPDLQLAQPAASVPWTHGTILRRPASLPVCGLTLR
ncbi:putative cytochrome P450 hydroxylase [Aquitalea magnusonii]|uniref:Putative cytochrome P450 hydroxylase n=1 Tax=Aquitalea magnusonii TaxID=332411 RepID=A0A3G9GFE0_9NEIS|nr:cytochrome P450 [Aquitalea magnusonii]BBF84971.1 putative cytochrome P450 hydroxylase [Aquitalea magnusonii]